MAYIEIKGLKIFAHHGVLDFEKNNGQEFFVDIAFKLNIDEASNNDDLNKTVNYALVAQTVYDFTTINSFDLIETLSDRLAAKLLSEFGLMEEVTVCVHKPNAPINLDFEDVSVTVNKKWSDAYIAVGSNLGDKEKYITDAIDLLNKRNNIKVIKSSKLIVTKPYGGVKQDDFVNGAVYIKTFLTPQKLLDVLHEVEAKANRKREIHWGPRTLDLDIIFYEGVVMNTDTLTIPHIDMQNRMFVLEPLMELCPSYLNAITNKTVYQMYQELKD